MAISSLCSPDSWADPAQILRDDQLWASIQVGRDTEAQAQKLKQSIPLTMLNSMKLFPEMAAREEIVIFIIGAVEHFEGLSDWTVLWKLRPSSLKRMEVVTIFPNVGSRAYMHLPACQKSGNATGLQLRCITSHFPFSLSALKLQAPDLAFISAPGFPQEDRISWDPAIRFLLMTNTPTIWSHYHDVEAAEKLDKITGSGRHDWHDIQFPSPLPVTPNSSDATLDVAMFNIEVQYTRSTLSVYAEAMNVPTSNWVTTYVNPFAVEGDGADESTDEDDGEELERILGMSMNIALVMTGGVKMSLTLEEFTSLGFAVDPQTPMGGYEVSLVRAHKDVDFADTLRKHTPIYGVAMWKVMRWVLLHGYGASELEHVEKFYPDTQTRLEWLTKQVLPYCGSHSQVPKKAYKWHSELWEASAFDITTIQSYYVTRNLRLFFGVQRREICFEGDEEMEDEDEHDHSWSDSVRDDGNDGREDI